MQVWENILVFHSSKQFQFIVFSSFWEQRVCSEQSMTTQIFPPSVDTTFWRSVANYLKHNEHRESFQIKWKYSVQSKKYLQNWKHSLKEANISKLSVYIKLWFFIENFERFCPYLNPKTFLLRETMRCCPEAESERQLKAIVHFVYIFTFRFNLFLFSWLFSKPATSKYCFLSLLAVILS